MISRLISFLMVQASVFISLSSCINASNEWIADDRVRRLDSAPVLGRGYSMRTNSYLATCLVVRSTSVPSFNYKFERYFLDPSESVDALSLQVERALPDSIARGILESALVAVRAQKAERESQQSEGVESDDTSAVTYNKYFKVASMHVDRYYSSVMESTAMLSPDAQALLENEDYEGFFKTCGTYFIRSIRRTQELTVRFEFESASDQTARAFSSAIDTFTSGRSFDAAFAGLTDSYEMASLVAVVEANGLGQAIEDGSDESSLVLSDISQLNNVLKFGYKSMASEQQHGSGQAGKVHSIEVVQWSSNPTFQALAKVHSHKIYQAVPFEEIPNVKANGTCRRLDHTRDMFGKCCAKTDTISANSTHYYCQPQRLLPPVKMKYNMEQNGEFVATLAGIDRSNNAKMNQLQDCVQNLNNNFRPIEDYKYLKSRALRSEESLSTSFPGVTVKELKMILDPSNDLSLVELLGFEIEEYRSKFYEPCVDSLYFDEENTLAESGRAAKFFMAHPYSHHEECKFFNCAFEGMRWNRDSRNGGCVKGLLTHGPTYEDDSNAPQCAKMIDQNTMKVKCVRDQEMLLEIQTRVNKCWGGLPIMNASTSRLSNNKFDVSLMSFVERYCGRLELDPLLGEADSDKQTEIDEMAQHCDGHLMSCADGTPCYVGRYCDRQTGFCERKIKIGERCEHDNDCFANNAFCDGNANSSNNKLCAEKKDIGAECEMSRECMLEDRIVNVASNQETSQSGEERDTEASNRLSRRAVDGNTDENAVITQTIPESDPWWDVVLSNNYIIRRIKIYHEEAPSDEITLEIFDDDNNQIWIYKIEYNPTRSITEVDINSEVIGKRVRLSLQGDQKLLSLREVEVEGVLPRRCDGGKCSCLMDNNECGEGEFCDPNRVDGTQQCSLPKASGETCSENVHCQNIEGCDMQLGRCSCSTQNDCNIYPNKYCDIHGIKQCEPKKEFDAQCTYNHECDSYPSNSRSECHESKCRPSASFDYCIKTDHAEKWGWPPAEEVYFKETFADAEEACPNDWFMVLKRPSSAGFTTYCNANRWFDPNDIVDNEECMGRSSGSHATGPYQRDGIWLGGENRGAVYFRGRDHIVNLAMLGTASQSSTYYDENDKYRANKAIDGDISGDAYSYTSIRLYHFSAWWKVNLDNVHRINKVVIYNYAEELNNLHGFYLQIRNKGNVIFNYGPKYNPGEIITVDVGFEGDEVEIGSSRVSAIVSLQEVVVLGPLQSTRR